MHTGFIGLGNMGAGMAANLIKAGHEVTVYNRSLDKAAPLVTLGATAARHIVDACRNDARHDHARRRPCRRDRRRSATTASLRLCRVVRYTSRAAPSASRCRGVSRRRTRTPASAMLPAPVFGRPDAAAAAKLFVVAAGAPDAVDAVRPLLDAIGQRTFLMAERAGCGKSRKTEREFSHRQRHRGARRGDGAGGKGRRRPARVSRSADVDFVQCSGLSDVWRSDRRPEI